MRVQPWNLIFLAGFIVYVGIRGVFERRTGDIQKTVKRMDVRERILLPFVGLGSLLLPILYLFTPWLTFADYRLPILALWCAGRSSEPFTVASISKPLSSASLTC